MSLNTGYATEKEAEGIIEELFIHEGAHASLDGYHANVILPFLHLDNIIMKMHYSNVRYMRYMVISYAY